MLDAEGLQRIADEGAELEDKHGALVLVGRAPQPSLADRVRNTPRFVSLVVALSLAGACATAAAIVEHQAATKVEDHDGPPNGVKEGGALPPERSGLKVPRDFDET